MWARFQGLSYTKDTISPWMSRLRRWLTPVNISFIVPLDDPAACDYLGTAQETLRPYLDYDPQPADKLHITLYQVGYLRTGLALPGTWLRAELDDIAALARQNVALLEPF